ncbi:hypothetical protein Tco_1109105 [Tanacetum coccineum]
MKREGRQHGVVTCYQILPSSLSRQRYVKMVESASNMGVFAKVPTKPTNQSKFTGKCRKPRCNGCHIHPACKAKDKAKGVLAYLADDGGYDNYDYDYEDRVEENYDHGYNYEDSYDIDLRAGFGLGIVTSIAAEDIESDVDCGESYDDDDDDDRMSFCDVGLWWGHEDGDVYGDEDGWYLVGGEMQ